MALWAQDFEVAPVYVNFQVEPGNSETRKVTIINHGDRAQTFNLTLSDYEIDENGSTKKVKDGQPERSLKEVLTFSPSVLELPPNGKGAVDLILTVPSGDYNTKWGIVSVEATKERVADQVDKSLATGVIISPRIAIFVNQSPRSNNKYSAKILSFTEITEPGDKRRKFSAVVHNTGDKIIKAKTKLLLANIQTGEEKEITDAEETVYPGTKKTIEFSIAPPAPGKYALAVILDYGHNTNLEGAQIVIDQK